MTTGQPQWSRRQIWTIQVCKAVESAGLAAVVGLSYWAWGSRTPHPKFELASMIIVSIAMASATTIRARLLNRLASKKDRMGLAYYDGWFRVGWIFVPWLSYFLIVTYADTTSDWFPVIVTIAGAGGAFLRSLTESLVTYPTPSPRTPTPDPPPTIREMTYPAQMYVRSLNEALND